MIIIIITIIGLPGSEGFSGIVNGMVITWAYVALFTAGRPTQFRMW